MLPMDIYENKINKRINVSSVVKSLRTENVHCSTHSKKLKTD